MSVVYLGGAINGCTDDVAKGWREAVKPILIEAGHTVIDPMDRDFRGREHEPGIAVEIVEGDKDEILHAGILLMNCPLPSWGTGMEILFGWTHAKRVIAVVPGDRPPSPWISYHAEVRTESIIEVARSL